MALIEPLVQLNAKFTSIYQVKNCMQLIAEAKARSQIKKAGNAQVLSFGAQDDSDQDNN